MGALHRDIEGMEGTEQLNGEGCEEQMRSAELESFEAKRQCLEMLISEMSEVGEDRDGDGRTSDAGPGPTEPDAVDGGAELEVAEGGDAREPEESTHCWRFVEDKCPWEQRNEIEKTREWRMHMRGEFVSDEFLAELAKMNAALDAVEEALV